MYADNETGDVVEDGLKCVCVLAHDPQTTYSHTGKTYEKQLYFAPAPDSVIVDPWRNYFSSEYRVLYYGRENK